MSDSTPAKTAQRSMVWMKRKWSDAYPDTLEVWVQTSAEDGKASVVVTGHAVWLSPEQTAEVILHLAECKSVVEHANAGGPRSPILLAGGEHR